MVAVKGTKFISILHLSFLCSKLRVQQLFSPTLMYIAAIFPSRFDDDVIELPYFANSVPAGFPSPAQDYFQESLDISHYIVKNRESTFYMRVEGEALKDFAVMPGDLLVVDRSFQARDNNLVIAVIDGMLLLRRMRTVGKRVFLTLEDDEDTQEITYSSTGEANIEIWGTVTFIVHDVT
jgi:DNA polymerase V